MSPGKRRPPQESGFIDFGEAANQADPAVSALLGQVERRQSEARLPHKVREKKKKEREKIRARRPFHTTYDIPLELRQRIKELAEAQGLPASQIATLGLLRFVEDLANQEIDLSAHKVPSRSPRYDYNLVIPMEDFPATFAAPHGPPRRRNRQD
jgi:hypothetical protein